MPNTKETAFLLILFLLEVLLPKVQGSFRVSEAVGFEFTFLAYENSDEWLTYADAKSDCKSRGSRLVDIKTKLIDAALDIQLDITTTQSETWWTSGNYKREEGSWKWGDGTSFIYTNWVPGEPNDNRNVNCMMKYKIRKWKWIDNPCIHKSPYICQKEISGKGNVKLTTSISVNERSKTSTTPRSMKKKTRTLSTKTTPTIRKLTTERRILTIPTEKSASIPSVNTNSTHASTTAGDNPIVFHHICIGIIIGICVGTILLIVIIILGIYMIKRKRTKSTSIHNKTNETTMPETRAESYSAYDMALYSYPDNYTGYDAPNTGSRVLAEGEYEQGPTYYTISQMTYTPTYED